MILGDLQLRDTIEIPILPEWQYEFGTSLVFEVASKNYYQPSLITLGAKEIFRVACFDIKEPSNPNTNRAKYGNNRYIHSNIHQWLNSNAAAGSWYSPQHTYDAPPVGDNSYTPFPGFLRIFDPLYTGIFVGVNLPVTKANIDGGGTETITNCKVFLASEDEVLGSKKFDIYSDLASAYKIMSAIAYAKAILYSPHEPGISYYWLTRTPEPVSYSNGSDVCTVPGTNTNYYSSGANYTTTGIAPFINIRNNARISSTPNSNGNYTFIFNDPPTTPGIITAAQTILVNTPITITWPASTDPDGDPITYIVERSINNGAYAQVTNTAGLSFTETVQPSWNILHYRVKARDSGGLESDYTTSATITVQHNRPPTISGSNGNLGVKSAAFGYQYTVTDPDNDAVSSTEKLNSKTLRTFNVQLGQQNTLSVTGNDFLTLPNGQHTITVDVRDSGGLTASRAMTFTKQVNEASIAMTDPFESDEQPSRMNLNVKREIPIGAEFTVEASNNPFDTSPVWENCTNAVLTGFAHIFSNKVNTAARKGLAIRMNAKRSNAIGAGWISGFGGDFE